MSALIRPSRTSTARHGGDRYWRVAYSLSGGNELGLSSPFAELLSTKNRVILSPSPRSPLFVYGSRTRIPVRFQIGSANSLRVRLTTFRGKREIAAGSVVREVDADVPKFWSRCPASKETLITKFPLFPFINSQRVVSCLKRFKPRVGHSNRRETKTRRIESEKGSTFRTIFETSDGHSPGIGNQGHR
jgi:hypothetical protein